jgi:formate hydrogenlyase transcriptional activator
MSDEASRVSVHRSRYDALLRISRNLPGHQTIAELLRGLAEHLHPLVPFDYLALLLHDERLNELRLVVLEPADIVLPFASKPVTELGPATTVWTTQKGAVIPIPEDGPLPPALETLRDHGRKMTCWLPLTTAYRRVGVLSFGSRSGAAYAPDALAFMEQVAAIVAIAADNGINYEQAQRSGRELRDERDHLRFLLDINNLLVTQLDYPALLEAICEAVQRVIEADVIGVALFDRDAGQLRLDALYDKVDGFKSSGTMLPLDRSAAGVTFQRAWPVCSAGRNWKPADGTAPRSGRGPTMSNPCVACRS